MEFFQTFLKNFPASYKIPANTQRCSNVVVRLQHRFTNTQHCRDADTTLLEIQVAPTLLQRWIVILTQ